MPKAFQQNAFQNDVAHSVKAFQVEAASAPDLGYTLGNSLAGLAVAQREIAYAGGVITLQRDIPYVNSGVVRIPEVQR